MMCDKCNGIIHSHKRSSSASTHDEFIRIRVTRMSDHELAVADHHHRPRSALLLYYMCCVCVRTCIANTSVSVAFASLCPPSHVVIYFIVWRNVVRSHVHHRHGPDIPKSKCAVLNQSAAAAAATYGSGAAELSTWPIRASNVI